MTYQVAGTNYKQTPIAGRERLGRGVESLAETLAYAAELLGASECVLLRTCNRLEIYFIAPVRPSTPEQVQALFTRLAGASGGELTDSIYHFTDKQAVRHLFEVASGLDSMILGEHEILGQVKAALGEATRAGQAGARLTRLFRQAMRTGKRARAETAISSGIFSVGQCACRLAQQALGGTQGKQVLLFGAGIIAKAVAKHLSVACGGVVRVFSRTLSRAKELAESLGGEAVASEQLPGAFSSSDVVVGCASAPHHVIGVAQVKEAMQARGERPMVVIDLGVPRNVDPAVGALAGVHLYNLDDLEAVVAENAKARQDEIRHVEAIIEEELARFEQAEAQELTAELIVQLRAKAEELRQECLRRADGKLSAEGGEELLDYITDLLVRKLLHQPILALKEAAYRAEEGEAELAAVVARIFGLNGSNPSSVRENPQIEPEVAAQTE